MTLSAWFIFVLAALLEVGGDAVIRKGLRTQGVLLVVAGVLVVFYPVQNRKRRVMGNVKDYTALV